MKPRSKLYVARDRIDGQSSFWVKHDVVLDHRLTYSVAVMKVFEHEASLYAGRFAEFTFEPQEWEVRVRHENSDEPWWHRCETIVNWIASNVDEPWSLTLNMEHVSAGSFVFSFANSNTATFFKILFV